MDAVCTVSQKCEQFRLNCGSAKNKAFKIITDKFLNMHKMSQVMSLLLALCLLVKCVGATESPVAAVGAIETSWKPPIATDNIDTRHSNIDDESTNSKAVGALTSMELQLFVRGLNSVRDALCRRDLNATLRGIVAGQRWATAMYDATVKSAVGLESGVLYQFGHYDECLDRQWYNTAGASDEEVDNAAVHTKYCLADVALDGRTVKNIGSRRKPAMNYTVVHWGACVPASCQPDDIAVFLQQILQRPVQVPGDEACELSESDALPIDNAMLAYAIVILFFVFLAALSTTYHAYLICASKRTDDISKNALRHETLTIALLSFSIIENTKKLFQASKDQLGLNSINGIKALAMLLILAGHALSFIYGSPAYNAAFIDEQTKLPTFAFLYNSLLFVDTFLLLSGFLFCRILLIELERRRGQLNPAILYVARYIRLTPAYMAVIGFYMTWFPRVGNGPLWRQRIGREQERCQASWWLNILYINNYVNTDQFCMFQSWYLSVDSQLFFIAPIVIYLLYKSRKLGQHFLVVLAVCTTVVPFVVTYVRKLDPTLLAYADELSDLASNAFYIGYYIKTHMRAAAYFIGLLTGFAVHLMQEKGVKLPTHLVRLLWLLAIAIGSASMFSVSRFYTRPFTNFESTLYSGCHKLGWNLSVAWLVIAATTGHAGWLQSLLSSRAFAPISRLTYCAYLSNGIVELYHSSLVRSVGYVNYINLGNDVLSHIADTFVLAFVLCLLFESPIHALERILLRRVGRPEKRAAAKEAGDNQTPSTSEEQVA